MSSKGCAFWVIYQSRERGRNRNRGDLRDIFRITRGKSLPFLRNITPKCRYFQPKSAVDGAPLRRDRFNAEWLLWVHKDSGSQRNLFGVNRRRWEAKQTTFRVEAATSAQFRPSKHYIPPPFHETQGKDVFLTRFSGAGEPRSGLNLLRSGSPERGCFCRKWRHRPLVSAWPRRGEEYFQRLVAALRRRRLLPRR